MYYVEDQSAMIDSLGGVGLALHLAHETETIPATASYSKLGVFVLLLRYGCMFC